MNASASIPRSPVTRRSCGSPFGPSAAPMFAPASCLRSPGPRSRAIGFTLLELLAAMALLVLLMLGVWSGIRTATRTAGHTRATVDHLDAIRGAEQFLRRNFSRVSPMPWARDDDGRAIVFSGGEHAMRFVAPLPGFLGRMGPQWQKLALVPDGHGRWNLEISFEQLSPDGSRMRPIGKPEVLLTGIRQGRFVYRGRDLRQQDLGWRTTWSRPTQLPSLVRIELRLDHGDWPTLTAPLRVDSGAVDRASAIRGLWAGGAP